MRPFRLALFADSAYQWLAKALEEQAAKAQFPLELRCWGFVSPLVEQQALADFQPDAVVLWTCAEQARTQGLPELAPMVALPYHWLVCNLPALDDGAFGSYALKYPTSLRSRLLQWNLRLLELAAQRENVTPIDLEGIVAHLGRKTSFDARLWEAMRLALTPTGCEVLAQHLLAHVRALRGQVKKVLVTDLDDTLWSGIVSEVGPVAIDPEGPGRRAYHAWLKTLAERGILLAIASRNDLATVKAVFEREDVPFSLDDFAAVEVAWDRPKSAMLQAIASQLGVHVDSLVFIDDREEHRNEVRAQLPAVTVPELPEDSAQWMDVLSASTAFETLAVTEDDRFRAASLRANQQRLADAMVLSPEAYLERLEQVLTPSPLQSPYLERAAQLTQRCNRFNMCGTRHTADDLAQRTGWVYHLKDKYGDLGMVSVVVLEGREIKTWVLSCRAFGRQVERLILDHLKATVPQLCGAYIPTERNQACATLYVENGVPSP
ncbi:MAG: HAD-IIIC family phosphatase [bacterium]|nr:HAD-IIIC family phosphatase [bacterium]